MSIRMQSKWRFLYLSYYSPSEVCWFGLEHMNLGYHHFERLPSLTDGIFAGKPYEEGKPGYQYERIPPYVTTFNPGLDPELPLYKPLPMFNALKAALTGGTWTPYQEVKHPQSLSSLFRFMKLPVCLERYSRN